MIVPSWLRGVGSPDSSVVTPAWVTIESARLGTVEVRVMDAQSRVESTAALVGGLMAPLGGWLGDRFGFRNVLVVALAVGGAVLSLMPFVPSVGLLAVLAVGFAAATSTVSAMVFGLLATEVPAERRSTTLNLVYLPLYAAGFGVGYGLVGFASSAAAIGTLLTDVPAGAVLGRVGLRPTMILGSGLVAMSTLGLVWSDQFPGLVLLRFLAGIGAALWALSRHAYIAEAIAPAQRGQALSVFGGINRLDTMEQAMADGFDFVAMGSRRAFRYLKRLNPNQNSLNRRARSPAPRSSRRRRPCRPKGCRGLARPVSSATSSQTC